MIKPLNAEGNPICHLLALLRAHRIFHVSGLRVDIALDPSKAGPSGFRHMVASTGGKLQLIQMRSVAK